MKRLEFIVRWPVQGIACFRSRESELVLSDVYWRWILEALSKTHEGLALPFVKTVKEGFGDPSHLVETIPATTRFVEVLQQVESSGAPSFELLVPSEGCQVPTAKQILAEFQRVVAEAVSCGSIEMEIE
jgi:hypothetical protein